MLTKQGVVMRGFQKKLWGLTGLVLASVLVFSSPVSALSTASSALKASVYIQEQFKLGNIPPVGYDMGELDWAAIGLIAEGSVDPKTIVDVDGVSLENRVINEATTAYGRKIIALSALSADNAAAVTGLLGTRNSGQFGLETSLSEDYFGIMAASVAEDPLLTSAADDSLDFVLTAQNLDGGFGYGVGVDSDSNMTAAAIVAMSSALEMGIADDGIGENILKAIDYLLSTKADDGGFRYDILPDWGVTTPKNPDADSTAWSIMALRVFGEQFSQEIAAAEAWMVANQNADGGFNPSWGIGSNNYTTTQSLIALSGKTWLLEQAPIVAIESLKVPTPAPVITPEPQSVAGPRVLVATVAKEVATVYEPTAAALESPKLDVLAENQIGTIETTIEDGSTTTTVSPDSWKKTLGYGLIVAGVFVLVGYIIARRRVGDSSSN